MDLVSKLNGNEAVAIEATVIMSPEMLVRAREGDRKMQQAADEIIRLMLAKECTCMLCEEDMGGDPPLVVVVLTDMMEPLSGALGLICDECGTRERGNLSGAVRRRLSVGRRVARIHEEGHA